MLRPLKMRLRSRIVSVTIAGLVVLTLCATLDVALSHSQDPIRVKVNLVSVAFVARDVRGALVDNLTQDDVDVVEDAVPQKIAFFSRSADVPLTLGVIVDASGSQDHFSKQHKEDLEVFFKDVLGPKDRVFLVSFANSIRMLSDFSQSGGDLLETWKTSHKSRSRFPVLGPEESTATSARRFMTRSTIPSPKNWRAKTAAAPFFSSATVKTIPAPTT